jgi:AcrR family transcriptional regulator
MGEDLWAVAPSAAITAIHRDPAGAAMAPRDPEATKAKLLAAARREFADKGIAGARVDAIAERAGVNKQLIYYYFGTKEDLFREILRERLATPVAMPDGPEERADRGRRLASLAIDSLADPDYVRLLMWEALEAGPTGSVQAEDERRERYQEMTERIRRDQAAGHVPAELDPEQVLLARIATVLFPSAFPQLVRLVTGRDIADPAFAEARAEHIRRTYG